VKGDLLFLADFSSKMVIGVFEASSDAGMNLEKEAWGGKFPWQIRVKRVGPGDPKPKKVPLDQLNEILGLEKGSKLNKLTREQVVKLLTSKAYSSTIPHHFYKVIPATTATSSTSIASNEGSSFSDGNNGSSSAYSSFTAI